MKYPTFTEAYEEIKKASPKTSQYDLLKWLEENHYLNVSYKVAEAIIENLEDDNFDEAVAISDTYHLNLTFDEEFIWNVLDGMVRDEPYDKMVDSFIHK